MLLAFAAAETLMVFQFFLRVERSIALATRMQIPLVGHRQLLDGNPSDGHQCESIADQIS